MIFTLVSLPLTWLTVTLAINLAAFLSSASPERMAPVTIAITIAMFILPSISIGVRRLHDVNRSGWCMALWLVPLGFLVVIAFQLAPGTRGWNRFGPDPKLDLAAVFA